MISFRTKTPKKLLQAYKMAIDEGRVRTWSYDAQGDFTHTPDQWEREAWFRPRVHDAISLDFNILAPRNADLSTETYAVYHGRFVESFLAHCDKHFTVVDCSAMPSDDDVV